MLVKGAPVVFETMRSNLVVPAWYQLGTTLISAMQSYSVMTHDALPLRSGSLLTHVYHNKARFLSHFIQSNFSHIHNDIDYRALFCGLCVLYGLSTPITNMPSNYREHGTEAQRLTRKGFGPQSNTKTMYMYIKKQSLQNYFFLMNIFCALIRERQYGNKTHLCLTMHMNKMIKGKSASLIKLSLIARFMGPTWGPPGAPWT